MSWKTVDCKVEFPEGGSRLGEFANAFRIMPDSGSECFLDFCVYSAQENLARVIARVRVHQSFLATIRHRLTLTMQELGQPYAPQPTDGLLLKDGQVVTPTGGLVLFTTRALDEEQ